MERPALRRLESLLNAACAEPDESGFSPLSRLFRLGAPLTEAAAAEALAPLRLAELERAGLVERRGALVRPSVEICSWRGLLLANDFVSPRPAPDVVLGPGRATEMLASLTVRHPVESALDLGTGSGPQALLAARHAERVVGTDPNSRALRLATLNAELNGIENVEWREGSLFEPVRGETFDLVVANPPYVVSPGSELLYRDGFGGDALSASVVSEAAAYLREGGYAHVMCNWIRRPGEAWTDTPRRWLEGSGCDVWLLHEADVGPAAYATLWNAELLQGDPGGYADTIEHWLSYYRREGIETVAMGAVVLRKRAGRNWFRADEMVRSPKPDAGEQVREVFAAETWLADAPELLDEVFAPADGLRLDETLLAKNGSFELERTQVRGAHDAGVRPRLTRRAVELLLELDGERPLRALVAEPEAGELVPMVRNLVGLGLLVRR
jgi:methylase of polypeptide subunit release factors